MNFFLTTKMFSLKSFTLPKEQFLWQVAWNKWFQCWRVSCIMKSDWWVITEDAFLPLASRAKTRRGQIRYASNRTSYWQNSSSNRNIPLKKFPRWLKCVCVCDKWLQSPPTLCDPVDCGLPGSSVHEILQARMLEWVAISFPGDLPNPGIEPVSLTFPTLVPLVPPGKALKCIYRKIFGQSSVTLNKTIVMSGLCRWLSGEVSACQCNRHRRRGFDP